MPTESFCLEGIYAHHPASLGTREGDADRTRPGAFSGVPPYRAHNPPRARLACKAVSAIRNPAITPTNARGASGSIIPEKTRPAREGESRTGRKMESRNSRTDIPGFLPGFCSSRISFPAHCPGVSRLPEGSPSVPARGRATGATLATQSACGYPHPNSPLLASEPGNPNSRHFLAKF